MDVFLARSYLEKLHSRFCLNLPVLDTGLDMGHKPDHFDFRYWVNKAEKGFQTHPDMSTHKTMI